jgi:hypothetical protein
MYPTVTFGRGLLISAGYGAKDSALAPGRARPGVEVFSRIHRFFKPEGQPLFRLLPSSWTASAEFSACGVDDELEEL